MHRITHVEALENYRLALVFGTGVHASGLGTLVKR